MARPVLALPLDSRAPAGATEATKLAHPWAPGRCADLPPYRPKPPHHSALRPRRTLTGHPTRQRVATFPPDWEPSRRVGSRGVPIIANRGPTPRSGATYHAIRFSEPPRTCVVSTSSKLHGGSPERVVQEREGVVRVERDPTGALSILQTSWLATLRDDFRLDVSRARLRFLAFYALASGRSDPYLLRDISHGVPLFG